MTEANNTNPQPKIGLKVAFVGIIGAGILTIVLVLVMVWGSGFGSRVRALAEAGEPTTIADLAAKSAEVPDAENAALALANISAETESLLRATSQIIRDRDYEIPLSDAEAAEANALLLEHADTIDAIRKAISLPGYGPQYGPDASLIGRMQTRCERARAIARVLALKSELLAREGKCDEAARVGIDMIRFGRHFGEEPSQMALLVSLALRNLGAASVNDALQAGSVESPTREALRTELASGDLADCYKHSLRTERVVAIESARQSATLGMTRQLHDLFDVVENQIEDVDAYGLHNPNPVTPPPTSFSAPAILAARKAVVRWEALSHCLSVVDRLTEKGDDKASLDDLEMPVELKADPFSTKPLTVERRDGGWSVYSIGQDGVYKSGQGDDVGLSKKKLAP